MAALSHPRRMNRKLRRNLLGTLVLAIVAGSGGVAWHASRPKPTAFPVRAVAEPAPAPPFQPVVSRILTEGPTMPYLKFNYLIKELPTNLPRHDITALLDFITAPRPSRFSEGEWGSLTNDIQEALSVQTVPSEAVCDRFIATYRDQARIQMMRDYALQHIGGFAMYLVHTRENRQGTLPGFFPKLVGEMKTAAGDPSKPWAGTALNLLDGLMRATEYRGEELAELNTPELIQLASPVAARSDIPLNARIPALQLMARRRAPEALVIARGILADPASHLMLVQSSAAVIGELGAQDDLALLEKANTTASRHSQPAIRTALKRLQNL